MCSQILPWSSKSTKSFTEKLPSTSHQQIMSLNVISKQIPMKTPQEIGKIERKSEISVLCQSEKHTCAIYFETRTVRPNTSTPVLTHKNDSSRSVRIRIRCCTERLLSFPTALSFAAFSQIGFVETGGKSHQNYMHVCACMRMCVWVSCEEEKYTQILYGNDDNIERQMKTYIYGDCRLSLKHTIQMRSKWIESNGRWFWYNP